MTANTKHTPGPWHLRAPAKYGPKEEGNRLVLSEDNQHVAEVVQYREHFANDEATALANADLIVQAPDMAQRAEVGFKELARYLNRHGDNPELALARANYCREALVANATKEEGR